MNTVFNLYTSELDSVFLRTLKTLYKGKKLNITIEIDPDETEYLLRSKTNRKALEKALNTKEGYRFTPEEFRQLSEDLQNGKEINFSKLKKVKLTR